jgi:sugar O-acyltransferase (sialic acid O-acetyltransferase NeuD family)
MATETGSFLLCGTGGHAIEVAAEFPGLFGAVYDPYSELADFEGLRVLRNLEEARQAGLKFGVIAVGVPAVASRIFVELTDGGLALAPPLVSPHAVIAGTQVEIGDGTLIMAGVVIADRVRVGRSCVLNRMCTIGHGARLDDFVSVMPLTALSGGVHLHEACYIGASAFIKEDVTIARGTTVGAMSGVFKDIEEPGGVWVGSPARPHKVDG